MGPEGQTSLFAPEPAPDPLLCWLWLAHVMGPASSHAGRVLDAFGGAQEAWEARDTAEFRQAAGPAAAKRAGQLAPEQFRALARRCAPLGITPGVKGSLFPNTLTSFLGRNNIFTAIQFVT